MVEDNDADMDLVSLLHSGITTINEDIEQLRSRVLQIRAQAQAGDVGARILFRSAAEALRDLESDRVNLQRLLGGVLSGDEVAKRGARDFGLAQQRHQREGHFAQNFTLRTLDPPIHHHHPMDVWGRNEWLQTTHVAPRRLVWGRPPPMNLFDL